MDPKLAGSQISAIVFLHQLLFQPLLDGAEHLPLADVEKLSDFQLGLAAPRMIRSMGELVDTVDNGISCQRQSKLLPHRVVDDCEAWLQPKSLVCKTFADM